MLLKPVLQSLVDEILHHRPHFGRDELVLGLRGEFRIWHLAGKHGREALAAIVAGERHLVLLGNAALFRIGGNLARERAAKASEMRAAVALGDGVRETKYRLVEALVPPERAFDGDALALGLDQDRDRNKGRLIAIDVAHERLDAALIPHLLSFLDGVPLVGEDDEDARIEKCELTQPMLQRGEIELRHRERLRTGKKRHLGSTPRGSADDRQRRERLAVAEFDEMLLPVAP